MTEAKKEEAKTPPAEKPAAPKAPAAPVPNYVTVLPIFHDRQTVAPGTKLYLTKDQAKRLLKGKAIVSAAKAAKAEAGEE